MLVLHHSMLQVYVDIWGKENGGEEWNHDRKLTELEEIVSLLTIKN